ncbi:MAG: CPBP family intramembrane metalloprotease [Cyanomargarita calcarea GSE-NOS-MK-12-04C]|uniref:CPBP family intramembrane metalloprotease n=1 Tax=Cyanomargarita calcarea GSE-NOS-MK-12-04C TaxID=2839659 RepID=A0A951QU04_9CYAN|nr:CPBP family intramembrane metalloprotease [Cyanomargarita calcarea GSE-NOS-MK-12-04C]
MFFLPALINFFQLAINPVPTFFTNAPALLVVATFFITWIGCWLPVAVISALVIDWQPNKPLQPKQKIPLVVSLYLLAPLMIWGVCWLTNTSFLTYGFVKNISTIGYFLLGFGLGVLTLATVFIGQFSCGWCRFEASSTKLLPSIFLPILLVGLLVGGVEELVFRGFLLTQLLADYSVGVAAITSSLIFASLHLAWERRETIPQLPGLWLMGMVLVLARFVCSGNLGLAWGLHSAWVWAIATLDTSELIIYTGKAPEWVTGKNKKPLAGVAGIICMLLTTGILCFF